MDLLQATHYLSSRDSVVASLVAQIGPCRLKRKRSFFITLFEAILWQQLSWHAACAIHSRTLRVLQTRFPKPRDVLNASRRDLEGAGLSKQKINYLSELSAFFEARRFPSRTIGRYADEEVVELLTQIKGVGSWTAEMFLIFGLLRADVFPLGDLGLRNTMSRLYECDGRPDDDALLRISQRWRPYRTVAVWYLWTSSDAAPFSARGGS